MSPIWVTSECFVDILQGYSIYIFTIYTLNQLVTDNTVINVNIFQDTLREKYLQRQYTKA